MGQSRTPNAQVRHAVACPQVTAPVITRVECPAVRGGRPCGRWRRTCLRTTERRWWLARERWPRSATSTNRLSASPRSDPTEPADNALYLRAAGPAPVLGGSRWPTSCAPSTAAALAWASGGSAGGQQPGRRRGGGPRGGRGPGPRGGGGGRGAG